MAILFNDNAIKEINRQKSQWREQVDESADNAEKVFETLSGLPVEAIYTPADTAHMDYLNDLGFPGQAPYVRGVHPTMYRGRTWTLRQLAGFGPPEETNKRYRFLLREGATGINGVFCQ